MAKRLPRGEFLRVAQEEGGDVARIAERLQQPLESVKTRVSRLRTKGMLPAAPRATRRNQVMATLAELHGDYQATAQALGITYNAVSDAVVRARRAGETVPPQRAQSRKRLARTRIILSPYLGEAELLSKAADRAGLSVEVYVLNAALTVARQQAPQAYTPHQLAHLQRAREAQGGTWTVEELRERGLPLYWDGTWLRAQLAAGETYSSLAARYGYNVRTMSNHGKKLGISLRRVVRLEEAGPWPAQVGEVAARVFDGDSTAAARWLSEQVDNGYLRRVQRGVYERAITP